MITAEPDDKQTSAADGCSGSGRPAFVMMVKTTNFRDGDDAAGLRWLDVTRFRAVLLQCEVRASLVVIANE
ncbi:MAG: hypothetical protein ACRD7E_01085 [Bryobacteraceae bacterium]